MKDQTAVKGYDPLEFLSTELHFFNKYEKIRNFENVETKI